MNSVSSVNISRLRKAAGLSREELATRLGVSFDEVVNWENGSASPSDSQIPELAAALGVSVDKLYNGDSSERHHIKVDLPFIHINIGGDDDDDDDDNDHHDYSDTVEGVVIDKDHIKNVKERFHMLKAWNKFPYPVLALIIFLALGEFGGWWNPGWLVFLTIPLYYWIGSCIARKSFAPISATAIVVVAYLAIGFTTGAWHPWWILFLTIPIIHFFFELGGKKD